MESATNAQNRLYNVIHQFGVVFCSAIFCSDGRHGLHIRFSGFNPGTDGLLRVRAGQWFCILQGFGRANNFEFGGVSIRAVNAFRGSDGYFFRDRHRFGPFGGRRRVRRDDEDPVRPLPPDELFPHVFLLFGARHRDQRVQEREKVIFDLFCLRFV